MQTSQLPNAGGATVAAAIPIEIGFMVGEGFVEGLFTLAGGALAGLLSNDYPGSDAQRWQVETGIYQSRTGDWVVEASKNDPFARPGQKKQGREVKERKKANDDWKQNPNKRQAPPKPHTPSKDHQKYPQ